MNTILIVDDDREVLNFLCQLVSSQGHRALAAGDAEEGLSLFQSECPQVVIVDLVMPHTDGFGFIRQLRTFPSGTTTQVIILTGMTLNEETRALAEACGVMRNLQKPCSARTIIRALNEALTSRPDPVNISAEFEREHFRVLTNQLVSKSQQLQDEISQSKRLENALQVTQSQLRDIIDSAMDAIITIDTDGMVILFNKAAEQMFQCPTSEAIGQPLHQFVPERFRSAHEHMARFVNAHITSQRMGHPGSFIGLRRDGTEFPFEASISQIEVEGRKLLTVILRDITERLRVEGALRETAERLKQVSRRVLEIQESERRHLARELHDEIGQVLSAVSMNLKMVKARVDPAVGLQLEESLQIVDTAIEQVRNLSLELLPAVLDDFGLESALRWCAERLSARTGLPIHLTIEPLAVELPFVVRNTCFRVAQEALTNVVRHASAKNVWIELRPCGSEILLSIRDDGKGFDVKATRQLAARGGHLGLLGIKERVELLDGKKHVQSEPGKGTSVQIQLPIMVPTAPGNEEES